MHIDTVMIKIAPRYGVDPKTPTNSEAIEEVVLVPYERQSKTPI